MNSVSHNPTRQSFGGYWNKSSPYLLGYTLSTIRVGIYNEKTVIFAEIWYNLTVCMIIHIESTPTDCITTTVDISIQ